MPQPKKHEPLINLITMGKNNLKGGGGGDRNAQFIYTPVFFSSKKFVFTEEHGQLASH